MKNSSTSKKFQTQNGRVINESVTLNKIRSRKKERDVAVIILP